MKQENNDIMCEDSCRNIAENLAYRLITDENNDQDNTTDIEVLKNYLHGVARKYEALILKIL